MPSILNPLGRFAGGFYSGMQKRKGFESDTRAEKARLFGEMRKQFPRATQEDLEGMLDRLTPHGESWQTSHLRSDDFPAPLGPNSAVIPSSLSESETCNEKSWNDKLRLVVRAVTIQTLLSGRRRLKA